MPRNLDSGAKIGSATFVATSVGFGPQGGQGGGGIRTHDRWDPRAASLTIGPRGVISPGESSPRGITPLGDTPWGIVPQGNHSPERDPLGNRLPGESFPWERPPWGIVSQGNHSRGKDPPGESSPWGIVSLGRGAGGPGCPLIFSLNRSIRGRTRYESGVATVF